MEANRKWEKNALDLQRILSRRDKELDDLKRRYQHVLTQQSQREQWEEVGIVCNVHTACPVNICFTGMRNRMISCDLAEVFYIGRMKIENKTSIAAAVTVKYSSFNL